MTKNQIKINFEKANTENITDYSFICFWSAVQCQKKIKENMNRASLIKMARLVDIPSSWYEEKTNNEMYNIICNYTEQIVCDVANHMYKQGYNITPHI
jgi:RNA recognition motif-containing protein